MKLEKKDRKHAQVDIEQVSDRATARSMGTATITEQSQHQFHHHHFHCHNHNFPQVF